MKWISKGNFLLFIAIAAMGLAGCKKDSAGSASSGSSDPTSPPTPGVVDNGGGFNVKVKVPTAADHYIHLKGDFDKACVVTSTTAPFADRDITCIVEAEELEAAFFGIEMVLNVPANMCKFVTFHSSYFYGRAPGYGPNSVTVRYNNDGQFVSGIYSSAPTNAGTVSFSADGTPKCQFDYTSTDGRNCCEGEYSLTTVINYLSVDPEKPESSTTATGNSWGGKIANCLSGGGLDLVSRHPLTNMPRGIIYSSSEGQSRSFKVGEQTQEFSNRNFWFANYYTSTLPTGYVYPTLPTDYMPPSTDAIYGASEYYEWSCYDDAEERKARIRVQIREWNESTEFELGSSGNPDTGSSEPDWNPVLPINDFWDWDDWITYKANVYPGFDK